jgi:hypothetical protein
VRLKVWSRFTIVNAAAEASRSLLHFGAVYGPDGAAGVDEMEGDVASDQDDAPVFIQMPDAASASEKLAFSRCDIFHNDGLPLRDGKLLPPRDSTHSHRVLLMQGCPQTRRSTCTRPPQESLTLGPRYRLALALALALSPLSPLASSGLSRVVTRLTPFCTALALTPMAM